MSLGVASLLLGALLMYAGWTGLSVTALLKGDNTTQAQRTSIASTG